MPMDLNLEQLDDGDGMESTLKRHEAKWHKRCRLKLNKKAFDELSRGKVTTAQQQNTLSVHTQSAHGHSPSTEPTCFFCNEPAAGSSGFHNASTYNIDRNVRKCALELEDTALLVKLAEGDMISIEAKYHHHCLSSLYNRARQAASKRNDGDDSCLHGIAFAQLVAYLEDMNSDENSAPVFKLTDIAQLYKTRLEHLGLTVGERIHTTRLKERLLSELPHLRAHSRGRDTLLSFEKDIGPALMIACQTDSDAMHLMRAAQVVRKEILNSSFSFDGSFKENCQQKAVPPSLLAFINMVLDGTNIEHQSTTKPALTISQLISLTVRSRHGTWIHQAQHIQGTPEKLHSLYICPSRSMQLHEVGG